MSAVPAGYESLDSIDDHYIKIAVPVIGEDPILIDAPRREWLPPSDIDAMNERLEPILKAQEKLRDWSTKKLVLEQWHAENDALLEEDRAPKPPAPGNEPKAARELLEKTTQRELDLAWLKPYMDEAEFVRLTTSKNIPNRTIDNLIRRLEATEEITQGESSASTDS